MTNTERAQAGREAMRQFDGNDPQTDLIDLLTNLRHMADEDNLNFQRAVGASHHHFNAEIAGDA